MHNKSFVLETFIAIYLLITYVISITFIFYNIYIYKEII